MLLGSVGHLSFAPAIERNLAYDPRKDLAPVSLAAVQPFVIAARIDHARDLLALTPASIGEVAAAAGFSDIYYFSRLFKRRVGVSPSAFRRNLARS